MIPHHCSHGRKRVPFAPRKGYTLIELLVTITIIAIVAILSFAAFGRIREKARAVTAMASLRQVAALHTQYSTENFGNINTVWGNSNATNHFWGRFQPYYMGEFTSGSYGEQNTQYKQAINQVLGTSDCSTMAGTPFSGTRIYHDVRGLPVPFSFNRNTVIFDLTKLRKMSEFPEPAQTLWACYGRWTFGVAEGSVHADFPTDGTPAAGAAQIYALPSKKVLGAFLDGRVEALDRPFDPLYYGVMPTP